MATFLAVLLLSQTTSAQMARSLLQGGQGPPQGEGGGGGGGRSGDGGETGGSPGGTASCERPPCACSLLGDVGYVTVTGVDERSGISFQAGENIYGPFEAGFSATQDFILEGLGCATGLGYVPGGVDTHTAEQLVATNCDVTLPRYEGGEYISLLDECGGHTREYHFHERMSCLYEDSGGHSPKVGEAIDGTPLLGKWLDADTKSLPKLDACGGRFGFTLESPDKEVYHYQIQDRPPFTFGCFGPILDDESGLQKLVSVEECRALYDACGDGDSEMMTTTEKGTFEYDLYCPCYDGDGSNVGTATLPAFADGANIFGPPISEWVSTAGLDEDGGLDDNHANLALPSLFYCTSILVALLFSDAI